MEAMFEASRGSLSFGLKTNLYGTNDKLVSFFLYVEKANDGDGQSSHNGRDEERQTDRQTDRAVTVEWMWCSQEMRGL